MSQATTAAPTCDDGLQNGDETDVDCGGGGSGSACSACLSGLKCVASTDCAATDSLVCRADAASSSSSSSQTRCLPASRPVGTHVDVDGVRLGQICAAQVTAGLRATLVANMRASIPSAVAVTIASVTELGGCAPQGASTSRRALQSTARGVDLAFAVQMEASVQPAAAKASVDSYLASSASSGSFASDIVATLGSSSGVTVDTTSSSTNAAANSQPVTYQAVEASPSSQPSPATAPPASEEPGLVIGVVGGCVAAAAVLAAFYCFVIRPRQLAARRSKTAAAVHSTTNSVAVASRSAATRR